MRTAADYLCFLSIIYFHGYLGYLATRRITIIISTTSLVATRWHLVTTLATVGYRCRAAGVENAGFWSPLPEFFEKPPITSILVLKTKDLLIFLYTYTW